MSWVGGRIQRHENCGSFAGEGWIIGGPIIGVAAVAGAIMSRYDGTADVSPGKRRRVN